MQRVAGTQLDPQGVAAFCALPETEWKGIRTEAKGRDFASAIEAAFEAGSCKPL